MKAARGFGGALRVWDDERGCFIGGDDEVEVVLSTWAFAPIHKVLGASGYLLGDTTKSTNRFEVYSVT